MAHSEAFWRGSKNPCTSLYIRIFLTLKIPLTKPFSELLLSSFFGHLIQIYRAESFLTYLNVRCGTFTLKSYDMAQNSNFLQNL